MLLNAWRGPLLRSGQPDQLVAHWNVSLRLVEDSTASLDDQGKCSLFVLMAHDPINTLGKATRHNMLVKAECSCGNVRYCRSADLMMVYGGGADPLKLKFDCSRCKPQITITLLEVHPEHLPKRLMIHKPIAGSSGTPEMFLSINAARPRLICRSARNISATRSAALSSSSETDRRVIQRAA
ncbi:hypothetical protein ACN2CC_33255 [Mesorhizobium muleiense]|uniref:hypothetical protein n=1 Tax=Mesorhizobium muleiense TaxID=1004279 RepID=UPI003AFB5DCB